MAQFNFHFFSDPSQVSAAFSSSDIPSLAPPQQAKDAQQAKSVQKKFPENEQTSHSSDELCSQASAADLQSSSVEESLAELPHRQHSCAENAQDSREFNQANSELEALWTQVAGLLLESLGEDNFERWFEEVELREIGQQSALFAVPNSIYPIWIETNYEQEVIAALAAVTGKKLALKFEVCVGLESKQNKSSKSEPSQVFAQSTASSENSGQRDWQKSSDSNSQQTKQKAQIDEEEDELDLIPTRGIIPERALQKARILDKFSLENFVVGESNRFAFAAVTAVADAPAKTYNPLFLHSRSGLGKTHLLHSIGQRVLSRNSRARVMYCTSEDWVNEFLEAIERRSLSAFRARYRNIDVLLLDDVQFLAGKDHCKSEFFHTFNTLFDGHKQIVLSSDRPASEIRDLEPRLRSRFDCGLTAEMEVPNREIRLAILKSKAQHFSASIKPEILEFLAQRISSDVRTLEGALVRVASYIHITQREPSLAELEHQLRDLLCNCSSELSINDIQREVSEHFGVSLTELSSRRRQAQIVYPRQLAMLLSRQLTSSTLKEIGDAFGGRDHGTVLHAVRKLDDSQGAERSQLDSDLQEIKRRLNLS